MKRNTAHSAVRFSSYNVNPKLTWRFLWALVGSPIFRVIGVLPIIGYFILYGDAFQNWFELNALGADLFLTGQDRLRLVYYGGVLLVLGSLLSGLFCPREVQKFEDDIEYMDFFGKGGRPYLVIKAIQDFHNYQSTFKFWYRIPWGVGADVFRFRTQVERAIYEVFRQTGPPLRFNDVPPEPSDFWETDYEAVNIALDRILEAGQSPSAIQSMLDDCENLLRYHFVFLNVHSKVISRIIAGCFAIIGLILVLIPAIETLVRVILLDVL